MSGPGCKPGPLCVSITGSNGGQIVLTYHTTSDADRPRSLAALADEANTAHRNCQDAQRAAAEHARDCGKVLLTVKAQLSHGLFTKWIRESCKFGERQARRYMTIATHWDELQTKAGAKGTRASVFTIRVALRVLSDSSSKYQPNEVEAKSCPSCGAELVQTSQQWCTCVCCWGCRLYGYEGVRWEPRGTRAYVGLIDTFEAMDQKRQRKLIAEMQRRLADDQ